MMGHVTQLMRVCGLSLVLAGPAVADYVTGLDPQGDNFLSLRKGPGAGYARIMKLGPDSELTVLDVAGKWRKVQLRDGTVGWAYGKYIAPGSPPQVQPETPEGTFGAGPVGMTGAARQATPIFRTTAGGTVVDRLRKGGGVIVLGGTGDWLRVLGEAGRPGYARVIDIAIGATPVPAPSGKGAAHAVAGTVRGWTRYVNPRFGTHIEYPAGFFAAGPLPANGDGQSFVSHDGRAEFLVFGQYNVFDRSLDQMREEDKATGGYDSVTYERTKGDWYVLSGYIGGRIYYRRVSLDAASDTVHVFDMTFDPVDKALLEPALTRMSRSFGHD